MNMPNSIHKPSILDEPTGPYQARESVQGRAAGRIKVALVPGSSPEPTSEIQILLRKRLRIMTLIGAVVFAVSLPIEFFSYEHTSELVWFALVPYTVMLAVVAAIAAILWSKTQLSLARLRLIELTTFGVLAVGFSWNHYHSVRIWLPIYAARGPIDVAILATFVSHIWFVLIVT